MRPTCKCIAVRTCCAHVYWLLGGSSEQVAAEEQRLQLLLQYPDMKSSLHLPHPACRPTVSCQPACITVHLTLHELHLPAEHRCTDCWGECLCRKQRARLCCSDHRWSCRIPHSTCTLHYTCPSPPACVTGQCCICQEVLCNQVTGYSCTKTPMLHIAESVHSDEGAGKPNLLSTAILVVWRNIATPATAGQYPRC